MNQNYSLYTAVDFQVWATLFARQRELLATKASPSFLRGIELAGFEPDRIPAFEAVNQRLKTLTGWTLVGTPGHVENSKFFQMLARREFPAATWIRPLSSLDYIEAPDLFHDVYGHVPMLTDPEFCAGLQKLGEMGAKYGNDPEIIELLARYYWFTAEFGLVKESGTTRIYGAGILSSYGETERVWSDEVEKFPFSLDRVLSTPFNTSDFQQEYFILPGMEEFPRFIMDLTEKLRQKETQRI